MILDACLCHFVMFVLAFKLVFFCTHENTLRRVSYNHSIVAFVEVREPVLPSSDIVPRPGELSEKCPLAALRSNNGRRDALFRHYYSRSRAVRLNSYRNETGRAFVEWLVVPSSAAPSWIRHRPNAETGAGGVRWTSLFWHADASTIPTSERSVDPSDWQPSIDLHGSHEKLSKISYQSVRPSARGVLIQFDMLPPDSLSRGDVMPNDQCD